ncbi:hypothetical protein A0H81_05048 [Grifola frondosa]|uniref:Uncharacterized protein n=1 Tax=Grifola frondosa TaxID=5627 RepID=A0A1C7MGY6_GRIFR|nr:hypothetical protein A0H81_05048 [Grifola frondosa]
MKLDFRRDLLNDFRSGRPEERPATNYIYPSNLVDCSKTIHKHVYFPRVAVHMEKFRIPKLPLELPGRSFQCSNINKDSKDP